jgi:hypothetical protein
MRFDENTDFCFAFSKEKPCGKAHSTVSCKLFYNAIDAFRCATMLFTGVETVGVAYKYAATTATDRQTDRQTDNLRH